MAVNEQSATTLGKNSQPNLSQKSPVDPKLNLVRNIAKLDFGSVPFSKLEIKTREDGKPFSVIVQTTYMVDAEGNIT